MPDKNGKLTADERKKITDWIQKNWKRGWGCPVCECPDWSLADHIVAPMLQLNQGTAIGGPTYPVALVICNQCGYTRHFNVMRLDIFKKEEEQKEEKEQSQAAKEKAGG